MNAQTVSRRGRLCRAQGSLSIIGVIALVGLALAASACSRLADAGPQVLPSPDPEMSIELPLGQEVQVPFMISGWAIDRAALEGTGIELVQVLDGGCEGAVIGIAEYGLERPDIAARDGERFRYSGWEFEVARSHLGERTLAVRTQSFGADGYNQCQALPVTVLPEGG